MPQLDLFIPSGISYSPYITKDYETKYKYSDYSISPEISLSQLLPCSGLLTLNIKDNIVLNNSWNTLQSESVLPISSAVNSFDIGLGLNQPLYIKSAYTAEKHLSESNISISYIDEKLAKNNLIIQSYEDYYYNKNKTFQFYGQIKQYQIRNLPR